jgi:hypothetical protein
MTDDYTPYGSVDEVAAKTAFSRGGKFYDNAAAVPADPNATPPVVGSPQIFATKPSLTIVNLWLNEISHQMDLVLSSFWFDVPIDATAHADVVAILANEVTSIVADMVDAANSTGRFFSSEVAASGKSRMAIINDDLTTWVTQNQDGLVRMNLTQTKMVSKKEQVYIRYLGIPQLRRMLPLRNRS